jgi:hypothetical protein
MARISPSETHSCGTGGRHALTMGPLMYADVTSMDIDCLLDTEFTPVESGFALSFWTPLIVHRDVFEKLHPSVRHPLYQVLALQASVPQWSSSSNKKS